MMWSVVAFIFAGLLGGYGIYVYRRRKAIAFFQGRQLLTDEEIFSEFYSDTNLRKEEVLELWKEVAKVFGLPYGTLRPTDRFGKELCGYWLVENEADELSDRAHNRLKEKGSSLEINKLSSLDEYIKAMASVLSASSNNGEKK